MADLNRKYRDYLRQRQALTGKIANPEDLTAINDSILADERETYARNREFALRDAAQAMEKRKMDEAIAQQRKQGKASAISGVTNLGLAGTTTYIEGAKAGLWGKSGAATTSLSATGTGTSGVGAGTAGASTAPIAAGTTEIAGGGGAGGAVGGPAGAGVGLGTIAGAAGWGYLAGGVGGKIGEQKSTQEITPWGGQKTEKKAGGFLAGAGAGAYVGSAAGPVGTVIGAIVGGIAGLFGDDLF